MDLQTPLHLPNRSSPEPPIKLFGQMIAPDPCSSFPPHTAADGPIIQDVATFDPDEDSLSPRGVEELGMSSGSSSLSDEEEPPSLSKGNFEDQATMAVTDLKTEESTEDGTSKTQRRPDNLVPCPRCDSLDTKFCYFNNYNVNQPRHFCKGCQRYWTAGGTLRNVPVGAGRRKNKHGSQHKQSFLDNVVLSRDDSDAAQPPLSYSVPQVSGLNPSVHVSSSSSLPSFRQDIHFGAGDMASNFSRVAVGLNGCQSLAVHDGYNSALVESEIKLHSDSTEVSNSSEAFTQPKDEGGSAVTACTSDITSNLSSVGGNFVDGRSLAIPPTGAECPVTASCCAFPFFCPPWPYMYMTMAGAAAAAAACAAGNASLGATSFPALDGAADGLWQWPPLPGGMWNPQNWSMPWNLQWAAAAAAAAAVAAAGAATDNADRPLKRPRASHEGMGDGSLCIPKTLRIDDPESAARSSILTTLGVDGESGSLRSGGDFSAFQPKAEVFQPQPGSKICQDERHANPAAIL